MAISKAYTAAIVLGATAGMRTLTPPALIGLAGQRGSLSLRRSPLKYLYSRNAALAVGVAAVGELVADKIPNSPSRLKLYELLPRIVSGAFCGATVCAAERENKTTGAIIGGLAALGGAFAGYHWRQSATEQGHVPPFAAALVEDAVAIGGAAVSLSSLSE